MKQQLMRTTVESIQITQLKDWCRSCHVAYITLFKHSFVNADFPEPFKLSFLPLKCCFCSSSVT